MLGFRKICRFWEKWSLACSRNCFLNAEFNFMLSGLYKTVPTKYANFFLTKLFWEYFVFCMIFFPFPSPNIHSTWADVKLTVLNMAVTPPHSFNFWSQGYEIANQNRRKLMTAVVQRVEIWEKKANTLLLSISAPLFWLSGLMILPFGSQSKNYVSSAIHFSYWIAGIEGIK